MSGPVVLAGRLLRSHARKVASSRQFSMLAVDQEFTSISTTPQAAKASAASVSTLSNGVVVITENSAAASTVAVTYPKASSSNEVVGEAGAALVNECLNFRTGGGVSTLMKMRSIENDGGFLFSSASRASGTTMGYTTTADKIGHCLPLLLPSCSFERWDIRDAKALALSKVKDAQATAQVVVTEQLFAAAFGAQSSMGRPYFADPSSLSRDAIVSFGNRTYKLNGAVVAATGIADHDLFCKEIEEAFASHPSDEAATAAVTSPYQGGEARVEAASAYTHLALAFDASGSSKAVQNVAKNCIKVLGHGCVLGFATSEGGLVGAYVGGVAAGDALVEGLVGTMTGSLSSDVIAKAKALAKGEALFEYESASSSKDLAQVMTASYLENSTFGAASGIASTYDSITEETVKSAFASMLKSKPAFAAVGNLTTVPYYGSIESRFN